MIDLNVRALTQMTLAAIPYMESGGHILRSPPQLRSSPADMNIYAATKAFVLSYSRALNRELGKRGDCDGSVCRLDQNGIFDVARKMRTRVRYGTSSFLPSKNVVARAIRDAQKAGSFRIWNF